MKLPFDICYSQDDKAVEPTHFMKDIFVHLRFIRVQKDTGQLTQPAKKGRELVLRKSHQEFKRYRGNKLDGFLRRDHIRTRCHAKPRLDISVGIGTMCGLNNLAEHVCRLHREIHFDGSNVANDMYMVSLVQFKDDASVSLRTKPNNIHGLCGGSKALVISPKC